MNVQRIKALFKKHLSSNQNIVAKREQLKNGLLLLLVACGTYAAYWYSSTKPVKKVHAEEAIFDGVFDARFNPDSDAALLEKQQAQIDSLQSLVRKNELKQASAVARQLTEVVDEKTAERMQALEARLVSLEQENAQTKQALQRALLSDTHKLPQPATPEVIEQNRFRQVQARNLQAGIETIHFTHKTFDKEKRTAANYVWAGTFASGILLTGVHADAGINGSKDTGTVMVRLTTGGIMPNGQHSRLEGCFVLGSSYGDLSGSSVVIHLETLSCADTQLNFEKKVYGSVFDVDAMQDLRGTSLLKTKPLLEYTAAAGLLAGAGDGLKNFGTTQSISESGNLTLFPANNIARSAIGGALTNPANKISDYIMKIADIYHPLVIAKSGRRVTVLFIKGFWIDKKHKTYESGRAIDDGRAEESTASQRPITPEPLFQSTSSPLTNPDEVSQRSSKLAEQQLLQQGAIND